jgi:hypothetical protein
MRVRRMRINMNVESIKTELSGLSSEQLNAVKGILEFNLRGLFIGGLEQAEEKLRLVEEEIERRKK